MILCRSRYISHSSILYNVNVEFHIITFIVEVLVLWLLFSEVIQSETFLLIFVCLLWSIKVSFTDQQELRKLVCLNQYKVIETLKTSLSGLQLTYKIKLFCYNVHWRGKHNRNIQGEELWGEKSLQEAVTWRSACSSSTLE